MIAGTGILRSVKQLLITGVALLVVPVGLRAEVASWEAPDLDRWFHQDATTPGLKTDLTLFADFFPGAGFSQTRAGTALLGFNTATQIPRVDPSRYQLNAVRVGITFADDGRSITYDPTPDAIAEIAAGTDDAGRPIELYGVGYNNDYEELGFSVNDAAPPEFEESSPLWPDQPLLQQTFNVFPLGDDGTGTLGNVFNSAGGTGIFELEGDEPVLKRVTREPWDSNPWAIGTVEDLEPGDDIPGGSVLQFDVDLDLPGVHRYFQESLSRGNVGVFLSSLHDVSGFHTGGAPNEFPAFYSKEHLAVQFGLGSPASLEIDYTIVDPSLAGDFDRDGDVDEADYDVWQANFVTLAGANEGDADGDQDVDGDDLLAWQQNFGEALESGAAANVPEPNTHYLAWILIGGAMYFVHRRRTGSANTRFSAQ